MYYPRLKDLREDSDLMQKEVAYALGIDQRTYSNYETGKREIPTHLLIKLADIYKTSTDYPFVHRRYLRQNEQKIRPRIKAR